MRITIRWTGSTGSGPDCSGRGWLSGSRGRSRTRSSMSCSPRCARTGTGRWWRSGSRPGHGPRSCSACCRRDADPGQQLITVIRKGSRAVQQLPASPDAFVWLRLYQQQMHGLVPAGRRQIRCGGRCGGRSGRLVLSRRRRAMFERANAVLGANWTLHDLRHSASYRMARDPALPLTDVQWILGHAHLSTTQLYLNTSPQDAIGDVLAHYDRRAAAKDAMPEPSAARCIPTRGAGRIVRGFSGDNGRRRRGPAAGAAAAPRGSPPVAPRPPPCGRRSRPAPCAA